MVCRCGYVRRSHTAPKNPTPLSFLHVGNGFPHAHLSHRPFLLRLGWAAVRLIPNVRPRSSTATFYMHNKTQQRILNFSRCQRSKVSAKPATSITTTTTTANIIIIIIHGAPRRANVSGRGVFGRSVFPATVALAQDNGGAGAGGCNGGRNGDPSVAEGAGPLERESGARRDAGLDRHSGGGGKRCALWEWWKDISLWGCGRVMMAGFGWTGWGSGPATACLVVAGALLLLGL